MNVWMRIRRPGEAGRRRGFKALWPLGCALVLHVLALAFLALTWRVTIPPPEPAEPVMLVSIAGPGAALASAEATPAPPVPAAAPPDPAPETPEQPVDQPSTQTGAAVALKPAVDPPKDLVTVPADPAIGGAPPPGAPPTVPSRAVRALAAAQAGGKPCQILDVLHAMLQTSDEVRAALPRIPPRARSVANAVMLWDRRWMAADGLGGPQAVGPIQSTVLWGIRAAPASCQMEVVRGPRLIAIGDARDTVVLAFGSGEWRWGDLLDAQP